MTRWGLRAFGLVAFVIGATLALPGASRAATIESGWWSRLNNGATINQPPAPPVTLPVAPPAPPTLPTSEGGLQVAALPDGATAVAAIRVDQELTSVTLRLAPNGDANGARAKLVACQALTPWVPVANGPWDAKPAVACDLINGGGSVAGIRNPDGSWTFPVAPIAGDGKTDFVVAPLADSDLAAGFAVPFQLVFVPPIDSDLVVAAPTTEPSVTPDGSALDDPEVDELFSNPLAYDAISGFGAPSAPPNPVVRPALDDADQAPVLPVFAAKRPDNASQLVAALMVLLGLGAFLWSTRVPTPPIASMVRNGRPVPIAEAELGGLGRFARERTGRPPSLH